MRRAYKTAGRVCGAGGNTRIGALLNYFLNVLAIDIDSSEYYLTMNIDDQEYYIEMT